MRTEFPTISMTWTMTSSPSMIFCPARLVMINTVGFLLGKRCRLCRGLAGSSQRLEQRRPHGSVLSLVDDLEAPVRRNEDGGAQVAPEVLELRCGPHGHEHVGLIRGRDPDPRGFAVRQHHLVAREELERVCDGKRERRVVDGVQPQERAVLLLGDQRITRPSEADEPVGELEYTGIRDLYDPEPSAFDVHWH